MAISVRRPLPGAPRRPPRAGARRIRLCLLCDELPIGGAEALTAEVLGRLDRDAFEPRILCLRRPGPLGADLPGRGVPLEVLGRRSRYDLRTAPQLVRRLGRGRVDVVLTISQWAPVFFSRLVGRVPGGPATVLALHSFCDAGDPDGRLPRWMVESMWLTDCVVMLGDAQRRSLEAELGLGRLPWRRARVALVPNGIALGAPPGPRDRLEARRRLALGQDDLAVGVVARLWPVKGVDVLLHALALLAPRLPRLRCLVFGDGPEAPRLERLAAGLGVAGRLTFAGHRTDVRELLPALDVACLPSLSEAYPLAAMEAMAAAVPVVASACGGLPELVSSGRDGLLVPPGDARALAAAIAGLLADPALRGRMGAAGRTRAERAFGVERTVAGYEALIRGLARRNGARTA